MKLVKNDESALESNSAQVVKALYDALSSKDIVQVHKLLAPHIDWWYHGPPNHQHLMRLLTGSSHRGDPYNFVPLSVTAFGSMVVVEGHDEDRSITWVHAWTVDDYGIIRNVREYLNTWVTVTRLDAASDSSAESSPTSSSSSTSSTTSSCQSVWESQHSKTDVPCLLLAI
ncbi:unnamed protein product [Rhodiola kirilowii]